MNKRPRRTYVKPDSPRQMFAGYEIMTLTGLLASEASRREQECLADWYALAWDAIMSGPQQEVWSNLRRGQPVDVRRIVDEVERRWKRGAGQVKIVRRVDARPLSRRRGDV